uniref:Retrovirus-related Pol polyprotein from transposon TNT 1-94 n=1 Tax=Tanacetum cinerariifolium TaxID=118510 RepID=A0A6L2NET5_TANCI|nr:hypothetical protein [Tanacetum cinerariifolium]
MSLTEGIKECIWLHGLVESLGLKVEKPALFCDSQIALSLAKNPEVKSLRGIWCRKETTKRDTEKPLAVGEIPSQGVRKLAMTKRVANKRKCEYCGNVARSRCPFYACKNCCAKEQNLCHIHVLKGNPSVPDKLPSSSSPSVDQQSKELSSFGNPYRGATYQKFSSKFSRFNNLLPVRAKKPLTIKVFYSENCNCPDMLTKALPTEKFEHCLNFVNIRRRMEADMVCAGVRKMAMTKRVANKPKCEYCGNVARSRCPFYACKNCCAKEQNLCHIHVLKGNPSVPDKLPSSSSPSFDQQSKELSSFRNPYRGATYQKFSSKFSRFNNLLPVRAKKPLTIKEASETNEWRFSKLKEYKERNIEIENEAFDRYLHNITLLEDVFAVNSKLEEPAKDDLEGKCGTLISELKMKLRADPVRTENLRDRMRFTVNNALRKLKCETPTGNDETELVNRPKEARYSSLVELNKKLSNARTDEDLKSCKLLKAQLFNQSDSKAEQPDQHDGKPEQKSGSLPSNWFSTITIDQGELSNIDAQYSSLEAIENL